MRSRCFSLGVVVVALAAFSAMASADTAMYDDFNGTELDMSKWYADTDQGFNVPTVSGGAVQLTNVTATADINSVATWTVGTVLEFKMATAPTGVGCFGYSIGTGGPSTCVRNDQGGNVWQFVVDDQVSGHAIFRSGDIGAPQAGDVYKFVWKANSMDLLRNGSLVSSAAGTSMRGNWGVFAYSSAQMSWDYVATSTVPEPATVTLLLTGVLGLLAYAWRKRR